MEIHRESNAITSKLGESVTRGGRHTPRLNGDFSGHLANTCTKIMAAQVLQNPRPMKLKWRSFYSFLVITTALSVLLNSCDPVFATELPASRIRSVLNSFAENTIPDITDMVHRKTFEFYITNYFKGQTDIIENWQFDDMVKMSSKFNPKGKYMFGAVEVDAHSYRYPVSPELEKLAGDLIRGLGTLKSIYLQPMANIGSWKKLKYKGKYFFDEKHADRLAKQVLPILDRLFGFGILSLYKTFFAEAEFPSEVQEKMNQALLHMIALNDPACLNGLRSSNGDEVIQALKTYLGARTRLQEIYGQENDDVLEDPIIKVNIPSKQELYKKLHILEKEMLAKGGSPIHEAYKVRPLSLIESPFRSCLASNECSTRHYFTRALDPAFYYFTVTDKDNTSRGHVTVALGQALEDTTWKLVAVVDKIQDIKLNRLPLVLEAVRRSVEVQGYELAFPDPIDETHNGLSNYSQIVAAVKNLPTLNQQKKMFHGHQTRGSARDYQPGYSLVFNAPYLKPVLPLDQIESDGINRGHATYEVLPPIPQKKLSEVLSLEDLKVEVVRMQSGDESERLIFIDLMEAMTQSKMIKGDGFRNTLLAWAKDKSLGIRLRNRALRAILNMNPADLPEIWPYFTDSEIQTVLLSWEDIERIRFERDTLQFAALTALPYFNPKDEVLEQLMNTRVSGLNPAARKAVIRASKTPEFREAIRRVTEIESIAKDRQYYVDVMIAIITYEALVVAEKNQDEDTVLQLRETTLSRLDKALLKLWKMGPEQMNLVAEKIAPILNRPSAENAFMKIIDKKIANLEPMVRGKRFASYSNFVKALSLSLVGAAGAHDLNELIRDPQAHYYLNSFFFWGVAAISGSSHFAEQYFNKIAKPLTPSKIMDYKTLIGFRKAALKGARHFKSCETALTK